MRITFMTSTIAKKLALVLTLVGIVPLIIVSYLNYSYSVEMMKHEIENNLDAYAKTKARHISTYFDDRKKDAELLAHNSYIIDSTAELITTYKRQTPYSPEYAVSDSKIRSFLKNYIDTQEYYDMFVISTEGDVVFTIMHKSDLGTNLRTDPYNNSELANSFNEAENMLGTVMSEFRQYGPSNEPAAFIATPLYRQGVIIGVLAVQMNAETIYHILGDYTGLGKTGEIIIASRIGDKAVFLNPLRHDLKAAFNRKITIGSAQGLPIQQAVQGRKGTGVYSDYRGEEVLVAWRYLPHLQLGMIAKQDTNEAYTPVYDMRNRSLTVGLIALSVLILFALLFSKTFSSPIRNLKLATEKMAGGDLNVQIDIHNRDEIGSLANSFNVMVKSLQLAEEKIKLQIHEKDGINKKLENYSHTISHDLKEPIRSIRTFSEFISEDYAEKFDDEAKDYFNRIIKASSKMQIMIDDLLVLSQVGRRDIGFKRVDVSTLINVIKDSLWHKIKESNTVITSNGLPEIVCQPIWIQSVFQNLISNSIKYGDKDKTQIEINCRDLPEYHEFSIKDNGCGIHEDQYENVFTLFGKRNRDRNIEGSGAGLAIVKSVIEEHRGKIYVDWSKPGEGTIIKFTIHKKLGSDEWSI